MLGFVGKIFQKIKKGMTGLARETGRRDLVRRWSRVRRSLEDPKDSGKWMLLLCAGAVGVGLCAAGYWWWSGKSEGGGGGGDPGETAVRGGESKTKR